MVHTKTMPQPIPKSLTISPETMELIVTSLAVAYEPIPLATAALNSVSKAVRAELPSSMDVMSAA